MSSLVQSSGRRCISCSASSAENRWLVQQANPRLAQSIQNDLRGSRLNGQPLDGEHVMRAADKLKVPPDQSAALLRVAALREAYDATAGTFRSYPSDALRNAVNQSRQAFETAASDYMTRWPGTQSQAVRDNEPAPLQISSASRPGVRIRYPAEAQAFLSDPNVGLVLDRWLDETDHGRGTLRQVIAADFSRTDGTPPAFPGLLELMNENPALVRVPMLQNPMIIKSFLERPRSVELLAEALDGVTLPNPTTAQNSNRLIARAPEQRQLSQSVAQEVASLRRDYRDIDNQPGFDLNRRNDRAYVESYVRDLIRTQFAIDQPRLDLLMNDIAANIRQDGGQVEVESRTAPKQFERAMQKVDKYNGDASDLSDLAAGRLVFEDIDSLYAALDRLQADERVLIVDYEDRFVRRQDSGYADITMKLRFADTGRVVEMRLELKPLTSIAKYEHAIYELTRQIKQKEKLGGQLTNDERVLINELHMQTRQLYNLALEEAGVEFEYRGFQR